MYKLIALPLLLIAVGFQLRGDTGLLLDCCKDSTRNGQGRHYRLPHPLNGKNDFSCSIKLQAVGGSIDQGIRCALMLAARPESLRQGKNYALAAVEFYKGISVHSDFRDSVGQGKKSDDWKRLPQGSAVVLEISYRAEEHKLRLNFTSEGKPVKTFEYAAAPGTFDWQYLSVVGYHPNGNGNLKVRCRIDDVMLNGQTVKMTDMTSNEQEAATNADLPSPEFLRYLAMVRQKLPTPGEPLINTFNWKNYPLGSFEYADEKIVPVENRPYSQAMQITVRKKPKTFFTVQLASKKNLAPIKKGDLIFIQLDGRCLSSSDESGEGIVGVSLVADSTTWSSFGGVSGAFAKEWKTLYGYGVAPRDYPAGTVRLHFFLSHRQQSIELGGIAALNLGQGIDIKKLPANLVTYQGREPKAAWRKVAQDNIEKYRKGDLNITVQDQSGRPVAGAEVKTVMRRHAYAFGCYVDDAPLLRQDEDGQRFRETFRQLFNRAIVPMFWGPGNAVNGKYGWENAACRQRYLEMLQWCVDNRISTHGHVLVYPSFQYTPPEVVAVKNQPDELRRKISRHIDDVTGSTKGKIDEWQVINEPYGAREFMDICGQEVMLDWFRQTRLNAPRAKLYINDNGIISGGGKIKDHQDAYDALISYLVANDAQLDGIGFQGHFGNELTAPETLWRILDRFGRFGKPLQVTEFTVALTDEKLQAEYTRDFYTAFFSHPATTGITAWGLWAGRHYDPRCALISKDWKMKPNGEAYRQLVFKEWWTDTTGHTDADGIYRCRGFLGDYEITVTANGKSKTVGLTMDHRNGKKLTVIMN